MSQKELLKIVFGSLALAFSGIVVIFGLMKDMPMMLACLSVSLGLLSAYLVFEARVEREKKLQEEIRRKLTIMKWENDSNLELLKKFKDRMDKLYPKKLLDKKLQQPSSLKYYLTSEEIEIIRDGKIWIQKQHCLYDSAIQVLEIGHYFNNEFIDVIKESIKKLDDLNQQKDFVQSWIIEKGFRLNPDEMNDLRNKINEADEISKKLQKMILHEQNTIL